VATELATNLLKYAQGGQLIFSGLSAWMGAGIEIVSLDRGPGIVNIEDSLKDGFSTSGTSGNGLGAVKRQSDDFDAYSTRPAGTVILSRIRDRVPAQRPMPFVFGALCRPVSGETVSGDAWAVRQNEDRTYVVVADGLGHGLGAADASKNAVAAFLASNALEPEVLLQDIHRSIRGTRGAAVAIAAIDWQQLKVQFAGVGNISGCVVDHARQQSMISHNGTVGHEARRFQAFSYVLPPGGLVVMHSDGLSAHWNIDNHPGLIRRHPSLIASILYREAMRPRDDASVIAIRRAA
jgi:hypothetical protein